MSDLNEYLEHKRVAMRQLRTRLVSEPQTLTARVSAEGRSGVRRIRIREFQVISDSPSDFAGYNLGPSSPELQLGVLGSCLTHVFLIQAAERHVNLEWLEVEVTGLMDARAGGAGFEDVPIYPHDISYTVNLRSDASAEELSALHQAVERVCPIFNLLRQPQSIVGRVVNEKLTASA